MKNWNKENLTPSKSNSMNGLSHPTRLRLFLTIIALCWAMGLCYYTAFGPIKIASAIFASLGSKATDKNLDTTKSKISINEKNIHVSNSNASSKEGYSSNDILSLHSTLRPRGPNWNPDPTNYTKPTVYFDISIDDKFVGRIIFQLFTKQSPRSAENFRALCTGEKGSVPDEPDREGAGKPLHFKGKEFYRVIDKFICQTGAGTESIYGGMFKDDQGGLMLKHDKKGLLSMANMGPDTNTSHFSIMMGPAPHLNGHYTIFGEVVSGMDVVDKINALAKQPGGPDEYPRLKVLIADSGQLECNSDFTLCNKM